MADVQVADNPEKSRYEASIDGDLAGVVFYQEREGKLILLHTEVGEEWEGRGVGSRLVAGTLESIRERGLGVVPICPFVRSYIERHPEYGELVAE